eukprot:c34326_g1_i1 orf=444-2285(+)
MALVKRHEREHQVRREEVGEGAARPSGKLAQREESVCLNKAIFQEQKDDDGGRGSGGSYRISIASGLVVLAIVAIVCLVVILPHSQRRHSKSLLQLPDDNGAARFNIKLACKATRFPDVCESTLSSNDKAQKALRLLDVIKASLEVAALGEGHSYGLARNLLQMTGGNVNLTSAAVECEYLLRRAASWFNRSQHSSLTARIKDIQAWVSAVLTYENDCHSALSYVNTTVYISHMMQQIANVTTLTSNALSMLDAYANYGEDASKWRPPDRTTLPTVDVQWANSLFHHSMQMPSNELMPSLIVSKDGLSKFTSIQAAVDAAPAYASERFIIYIKEGVYNETVTIPDNKTFLTFVGDGMDKTIITGNKNAQMPGVTTYESSTLAVNGDGFMARGITFENTADPIFHQAVALRVDSDLSAFYNCSFLGHQDTLYAHSLRQFYRDCKIEGTIDFIFGNSASVFQNCEILVRPGRVQAVRSTVTAQGRTDPAETTGFVLQNCTVNGTQEYMRNFYSDPKQHQAYLGRPWKLYSRTIFTECYLDALIRPEGWLPWNGTFALDTLFYGEYENFGPGSSMADRVSWVSEISRAVAHHFTVASFIQGDQWLPATNVPFTSLL